VDDTERAESTRPDHVHVVNNGKRELTLDDLARMQPGMDRLMAELTPRMQRMYYAARVGNWPLASYFYKSVVKQLRLSVHSRPKYDPEMSAFVAEDCAPVQQAIKAGDGEAFAEAYDAMVRRANELHAYFGKPFLVWKTPAEPPDDLDLTAGMDR
jgi:hypothetical protein